MNSAQLNRRDRRALKARREWIPLQRGEHVPLTEEKIQAQISLAQKLMPEVEPARVREIIAEQMLNEIWMK